jgi:hypothetical protein
MKRIGFAVAVVAFVVIATSTGCRRETSYRSPTTTASSTRPALSRSTHELTSDAVYYLGGPMQGRPPDGTFEAGTRVNVLETMGGYSRVRSESGVTAWVAIGALRPLGGADR